MMFLYGAVDRVSRALRRFQKATRENVVFKNCRLYSEPFQRVPFSPEHDENKKLKLKKQTDNNKP